MQSTKQPSKLKILYPNGNLLCVKRSIHDRCIDCKPRLRQIECIGNNKVLCSDETCQRCFYRSFASSSRVLNWSKCNTKSPRDVFLSGTSECTFNCFECFHFFRSTTNNVSSGSWCPYCGNKKLCSDINCVLCYNKSFTSSTRALNWSTKNTKLPRELFRNRNHTKYIFDCSDCGHEFDSTLSGITNNEGWCPYCSHDKLCADVNCVKCHENSFASNPRASNWSAKNEKSPRDVFLTSNTKYWFDCSECNHDFETLLSSVAGGTWCPYCSTKLCIEINCTWCFTKSFASSSKALYWSNKNNTSPRKVRLNSHIGKWFDCPACKSEFRSSPANVVRGSWCPYCKHKTERKVYDFIISLSLWKQYGKRQSLLV